MNEKKKINNWKESTHTKLSYYMGILAFSIQFFIGIRHISTQFGQLCILESFFALSGVLLLDILHGKKGIYPKKFKSIQSDTFFRFAITFGVIAMIQFLVQYVPITIRDYEYGLAVAFCGVSEEYFFRGILLEPFFRAGIKDEKIKLWNKKQISYWELFGILFSGIIFALFHYNYYGSLSMGLMVIVGGFWLGFCYVYWRDLTSNILAHFFLNTIFILQTFWIVNL